MKIFFQKLVIFVLALSCSVTGSPDPKVNVEKAFPALKKFTRPLDLQQPANGENYLYLVEQAGKIYKFKNDKNVSERELFLDISSLIDDSGNEEGLLGLAFHPEFKSNNYFFVNYTASNPSRTVIARFTASESMEATKSSKFVIMEYEQPYSNHNGGQVSFGPDGFLYISAGDGGSGGDPIGHGQNRKTVLGTILRIDVDNTESGKNYAIPADNPFKGNSYGWREEIFAYGLRNVWRFAFHPETNEIWGADVGQNRIEEINIIKSGVNYGWNIMEGSECFNDSEDCGSPDLMNPIFEYDHSVGASITGGRITQNDAVPGFKGAYIYGDFVTGKIWALQEGSKGKMKNTFLTAEIPAIASFAEDMNGVLYILSFDGNIYKFKKD